MKRARNGKIILASLLAFMFVCFVPDIVSAQALKTSASEILSNPAKYDGKTVKVEGRVQSLKFNTSKKGNAYTTFIVVDHSNNSLNVFSFGTLSIKRGDLVIVTGLYQKVKHVPPRFTFPNEIDASNGSVERIRF